LVPAVITNGKAKLCAIGTEKKRNKEANNIYLTRSALLDEINF